MNTCGECDFFNNGKCMASGFLGCTENDLLIVKSTDGACDTYFSEKE